MPHDHYKPIGRWRTKSILKADDDRFFVKTTEFKQFSGKMASNSEVVRFEDIDDDELEMIRTGLVPKNTKKTEKKCERCLMSYLKQKSKPQNFSNFEDKILGKFWFETKTKKGEKYTVSSLKHLRYGLNRSLKRRGHAYNIVTLESFSDSQSKFNDACFYLQSLGKGYVKHYMEIKPSGY